MEQVNRGSPSRLQVNRDWYASIMDLMRFYQRNNRLAAANTPGIPKEHAHGNGFIGYQGKKDVRRKYPDINGSAGYPNSTDTYREQATSNGSPGYHDRKAISRSSENAPIWENYRDTMDTISHFQERREYEAKLAQEERINRPPMWFCSFIANHTAKAFSITLALQLAVVIISIVLYFTGADILPVNFENFPLRLTSEPSFLRTLAWKTRKKDPSIDIIKRYTQGPPKPRTDFKEIIELFYEIPGGNILTKQKLKVIQEIEDRIMNIHEIKSTYCRVDHRGKCLRPTSILRFFDGTYQPLNPIFFDPEFENIPKVLSKANSTLVTRPILQFHLGKNARLLPTSASADKTRSLVFMGWPLKANGSKTEDTQKLESYIKFDLLPELDSIVSNTTELNFLHYNKNQYYQAIRNQAQIDQFLAFGSLMFIFCFMLLHTRSLWITCLALFAIITSVVGANLLYRYLYGYRYIGFLHVLSVFIILGIGADNVFIFYDNWRASRFLKYPSLSHRLSDCYRRAASAMFVTSFTTMMAFFVSGLWSPFMVVETFGYFSGTMILLNYLSVISFFPCVIIVYHKKFEKASWPCFPPDGNESSTTKKGLVVRFFRGPYFSFVNGKKVRWCIIIFFIGVIGTFGYFASTLKPAQGETQIFRGDTNYGKSVMKRLEDYLPNKEDENIQMYLVWGMKQQDLSTCDLKWIHDVEHCDGTPVWDERFNMNSPQAQQSMKEICKTLHNMDSSKLKDLRVATDPITGKPRIDCFMTDMMDFLQNETFRSGSSPSRKRILTEFSSLPINETTTRPFMDLFPNVYNSSLLPINFDRYFEVAVGYWMFNGYSGTKNTGYSTYDTLIGESKESYTRGVYQRDGMVYGSKLRYVAIRVHTSMNALTIGYEEGLPVLKRWEDYVKDLTKNAPVELQRGFVCTPEGTMEGGSAWHWLLVQQSLVLSALYGVIVSVAIALPILVLATQHVIVGTLAAVCIALSSLSVIGVVPLAGWDLGLMQSMNLCLVVGLSVDYIVHMAEGYTKTEYYHRDKRAQSMLEHVGISVLSGALSTLGASLFMLFAIIQFYMQFGLFMFCTVGFSIIYSLVLFTTILTHFGPEGDYGSLKPLWQKLKESCCSEQKLEYAPRSHSFKHEKANHYREKRRRNTGVRRNQMDESPFYPYGIKPYEREHIGEHTPRHNLKGPWFTALQPMHQSDSLTMQNRYESFYPDEYSGPYITEYNGISAWPDTDTYQGGPVVNETPNRLQSGRDRDRRITKPEIARQDSFA